MLSVKEASAGYNSTSVVTGINIEVKRGSVISLVGPNGAGKTTTIRMIAGLLKLSAGTIHVDGIRIDRMLPADIVKHGVAVVPQGRRIFPGLTVIENLKMGAYLTKKKSEVAERMEKVFSLFPILKERQKQLGTTLSGGEQQMLAIARGLMSDPKFLLLDEPSIGLAPLVVERLLETIEKLSKNNLGIFLVEQNAHIALNVSDYVYVLENGKIVHSGTPDELSDLELLNASYLGRLDADEHVRRKIQGFSGEKRSIAE